MGWQAPRADDPERRRRRPAHHDPRRLESSRLVRRLRDDERLVNGISMSYSAQMGGGITSLRAELEAKDLAQVERIILEEIAKIQESGPTEEERQLAITKFEAQHAFDTETSEGLANAYGLAETTWTLEAELGYVDRLRKITREQIRDAARRYLSRTDYAPGRLRAEEAMTRRRAVRCRAARSSPPPSSASPPCPPPPRRAPSPARASPMA